MRSRPNSVEKWSDKVDRIIENLLYNNRDIWSCASWQRIATAYAEPSSGLFRERNYVYCPVTGRREDVYYDQPSKRVEAFECILKLCCAYKRLAARLPVCHDAGSTSAEMAHQELSR
jgi:hypothetical protein